MLKNFVHQFLQVALTSAVLSFSLTVNAEDLSHRGAVKLVRNIIAEYNSEDVRVYLTDADSTENPGLYIGQDLRLTLLSNEPRYIFLVTIDPEGDVSVTFPDFAIKDMPDKYTELVYPSPGTGALVQEGPPGKQTVIVYGADKAITMQDLNLPTDTDVHTIGGTAALVSSFVDDTNGLFKGVSVKGSIYKYFVDVEKSDSELQYSSRAVRRELKRRVEQVDLLVSQQGANSSSPENDQIPVFQSDSLSVNDIKFQSNSDQLTQKGVRQLDVFGEELKLLMVKYPSLKITFEGHTDSAGTESYNQNLSERRALAVEKYVVEKHRLPGERVFTFGLGELQPIASNADSESRLLNRRVEIKVGR